MRVLISFCFLIAAFSIVAQETYPRNGVEDTRQITYAFTNAKIFVSAEQVIDGGTLLVKDGKIVSAGIQSAPSNAVVVDCNGKIIYPSFIDAYGGINALKKKELIALKEKRKKEPKDASNWNQAIRPEDQFDQSFPLNKKKSEDWLASGFGVVNEHNRDGIMRGTSQVTALGHSKPNDALITDRAADHFSFSKGSSTQDYPSSLVGAIALFRQTLYDAEWYAAGGSDLELNPSLSAITSWSERPKVFKINHSLSARNVLDISSEFNLPFIIVGAGKEYLILDELTADMEFILPLNYPKSYDVTDPYLARMVSLADLKHWENAPRNAALLHGKGIQFSLSRDTVSQKEFLSNLIRTIDGGLSHNETLKALTQTPARMVGIEDDFGTLESGKKANFIIADDTIGSAKFKITQHWTLGKKVFESPAVFGSMEGKFNLVVDKKDFAITVKNVSDKGIEAEVETIEYTEPLQVKVTRASELITVVISKKETKETLYRLSGKITFDEGVWDGKGQDSEGNWVSWAAIKDRNYKSVSKEETDQKVDTVQQIITHPNMAYGWDSLPNENTFVITNATVWTGADTGIISRADVYVVDGKIKSIGVDQLFPADVKRINAKGKHVTPGIVDEHSHIGLRGGVNEWAQASSAEVRMADAVDPWNVNIYRQLAGGVTSAQLLHGSANPIGGQSAIVKLKWGASAQDMLYSDSPMFIKFALGENVKRSNRKEHGNRYPLTRMGVEQSMMDAFVRAENYDLSASKNGIQTRRDLELDAIKEIANNTRHISCHSYVQSEILMLLNLADSMDFKVNTFTHILEGYKVSEELKEHGANASTFSDWWAYKFEVNDAIPYNAAMLADAGVNTAINSDDAEMGRRLNQEAAKTMKYGGMTEEQAMNMVTINPAKMLHIDDRVGSIEPGKDADLVIWSDNPLSVYAEAEKTFIEGILYYDVKENEERWERDQRERARIIQKMMADKGKKRKPEAKQEEHYHCDTELQDYLAE